MFKPPLFGLPRPEWDAEPLRQHAARRKLLLTGALNSLKPLFRPTFSRSRLQALFGDADRAGHFLNAKPLAWGFNLTEPQATAGFAHFLTSDKSGFRTVAFLRALDIIGADATISETSVTAETSTNALKRRKRQPRKTVAQPGRRIDLLIEWSERGARHAAAIEAKFGANFQEAQLSDYRRILKGRYEDRPTLVILALGGREKDRHTARRNLQWILIGWRTMLIRLERLLKDDDVEFARFRRSLWRRL